MSTNLINEDLIYLNDSKLTESVISILKIKNEIIETLQKKVALLFEEKKELLKNRQDEHIKQLTILKDEINKLNAQIIFLTKNQKKQEEIQKYKEMEEEIKKVNELKQKILDLEDEEERAKKYKKLYRQAITIIKNQKESIARDNIRYDDFIEFEGYDSDNDNGCRGWDGRSTRCECNTRRVEWQWSRKLNEYDSDNSFDEDSIKKLEKSYPKAVAY